MNKSELDSEVYSSISIHQVTYTVDFFSTFYLIKMILHLQLIETQHLLLEYYIRPIENV